MCLYLSVCVCVCDPVRGMVRYFLIFGMKDYIQLTFFGLLPLPLLCDMLLLYCSETGPPLRRHFLDGETPCQVWQDQWPIRLAHSRHPSWSMFQQGHDSSSISLGNIGI